MSDPVGEMGRPRLRHVPGLDGLRGAAVLAVVVFHLGHLPGGYLGVDLFFVLSGFLITSLLLTEGGSRSRISLSRFWARRARRLLPALGVMLLGCALYAQFAAQPAELHRIRWDGLATLFYVANWRAIFGHTDYWAMFAAPSPLEHSWSLAIEEQFYLVWPLVFVGLLSLARRRSARADGAGAVESLAMFALVTASGLAAVSLGCQWVFGRVDGWNRVYYGTDTRAFAVLIGAVVAAMTARFGSVREGWPRRLLEAGGVVAGLVLAASWVVLDGGSWFARHGGLPLCSLAGAVVVAAAVQPRGGAVARLCSVTPLRWLGMISYGVYLYHWPLIVWLTPQRLHLGGWMVSAVRLAATLAVALMSYWFVEQPIRHRTGWAVRLPRPLSELRIASVGAVVLAVALLVATAGVSPPPVHRGTSLSRAVAEAKKSGGPKIMVVGNSVADFLATEGFSQLVHEPPLTVLDLAVIACSVPDAEKYLYPDGKIDSRLGRSCNRGWAEAVDAFRPDYVIFARNGIDDAKFFRDGHWVAPCSPEFHDWSMRAFKSDIALFSRHGARVVLVTSLPSLPFMGIDPPGKPYFDAVACGNQVLRDVAAEMPEHVTLIDLHAHYCPAGRPCLAKLPDGTQLQPDGTHFRGESAQVTAQYLLARLGVPTSLPH